MFLALLLCSVLLPLHGTLVARLMHRPGDPVLSLPALWAGAWVAVCPPLGLALGLRALRCIRSQPELICGTTLAWSAIVLNSLGTLYLLVGLGAYLYDRWS